MTIGYQLLYRYAIVKVLHVLVCHDFQIFHTMSVTMKFESLPFKAFYCKLVTTQTGKGTKFTKTLLPIYYNFRFSLDTCDLKMYVLLCRNCDISKVKLLTIRTLNGFQVKCH